MMGCINMLEWDEVILMIVLFTASFLLDMFSSLFSMMPLFSEQLVFDDFFITLMGCLAGLSNGVSIGVEAPVGGLVLLILAFGMVDLESVLFCWNL